MTHIDILYQAIGPEIGFVHNEKSLCNAIEKLWLNAGLEYKREIRLLSGPLKNKKYNDKSLFWFNGSYYRVSIADFLVTDTVFEVKFGNEKRILPSRYTETLR